MPARQANASAVGNRARESPISESRRAARKVPERGRDVKTWASTWWRVRGDATSRSSISAPRLPSTATKAWVMAVPSVPVVARGADQQTPVELAGTVRPL